jgi:hypothetical protein
VRRWSTEADILVVNVTAMISQEELDAELAEDEAGRGLRTRARRRRISPSKPELSE